MEAIFLPPGCPHPHHCPWFLKERDEHDAVLRAGPSFHPWMEPEPPDLHLPQQCVACGLPTSHPTRTLRFSSQMHFLVCGSGVDGWNWGVYLKVLPPSSPIRLDPRWHDWCSSVNVLKVPSIRLRVGHYDWPGRHRRNPVLLRVFMCFLLWQTLFSSCCTRFHFPLGSLGSTPAHHPAFSLDLAPSHSTRHARNPGLLVPWLPFRPPDSAQACGFLKCPLHPSSPGPTSHPSRFSTGFTTCRKGLRSRPVHNPLTCLDYPLLPTPLSARPCSTIYLSVYLQHPICTQ